MSYPIEDLDPLKAFPDLAEIPEPPQKLFMRGSLDCIKNRILITVVGSRRHTSYGKEVCESLIKGLRGYPVVIVSGLALGIDAIAHHAAINAGLSTIALPGSGLDWNVLYPKAHQSLARDILAHGGALISEYAHDMHAAYWTFPRRNRLIAGISALTLVIEAEEKSGTLITARLATEYNRTVAAVPGAITSSASHGTNWLLQLGAVPITCSEDIIRELNLEPLPTESDILLNTLEEDILSELTEPKTKDEIIHTLSLDAATAAIVFSTLEIKGMTEESLGLIKRIAKE